MAKLGFDLGMFSIASHVWQSRLTVITYHRIADPAAATYNGLAANASARPAAFASQLELLMRWFNVISLDTLLKWLRSEGKLPPRAALITFDDGYRDNLTAALPALKARGLPAVIFVATGQIGSTRPFWWDRAAYCIGTTSRTEEDLPLLGHRRLGDVRVRAELAQDWCSAATRIRADEVEHVVEQLSERLDVNIDDGTFAGTYLDWDDIRQMAAGGFGFGAHTVRHPALSQVTLERARDEAVASRARLEQELGRPVLAFAYPHGGHQHFRREHEQMLLEEGFQVAFTGYDGPMGYSTARMQPMRIGRVGVYLKDDLPRFAAKLLGAARLAALRGG